MSLLLKIVSAQFDAFVSFQALKSSVDEMLAKKGQLPLTDVDWNLILDRTLEKQSPPVTLPQTPIKQEIPAQIEVFTPKKWRTRYSDKGLPGSTIRDRAYEFMKRAIEATRAGNPTEYDLLVTRQSDLKDQLKADIMTKEKDGDHEFLERKFVVEAMVRDRSLIERTGNYSRDKSWLEIQRTLRSKTQTILFKGEGAQRDRLDGGHRYAMFSSGANEVLGLMTDKKVTRNHGFHVELDKAFEKSTTRKGFIRRVRNIARKFIHPGNVSLTPIKPPNLIFGKTLSTDNPAHLQDAKQKLSSAYTVREAMFQKWEDDLHSGSDSDGGLEDLIQP